MSSRGFALLAVGLVSSIAACNDVTTQPLRSEQTSVVRAGLTNVVSLFNVGHAPANQLAWTETDGRDETAFIAKNRVVTIGGANPQKFAALNGVLLGLTETELVSYDVDADTLTHVIDVAPGSSNLAVDGDAVYWLTGRAMVRLTGALNQKRVISPPSLQVETILLAAPDDKDLHASRLVVHGDSVFITESARDSLFSTPLRLLVGDLGGHITAAVPLSQTGALLEADDDDVYFQFDDRQSPRLAYRACPRRSLASAGSQASPGGSLAGCRQILIGDLPSLRQADHRFGLFADFIGLYGRTALVDFKALDRSVVPTTANGGELVAVSHAGGGISALLGTPAPCWSERTEIVCARVR